MWEEKKRNGWGELGFEIIKLVCLQHVLKKSSNPEVSEGGETEAECILGSEREASFREL